MKFASHTALNFAQNTVATPQHDTHTHPHPTTHTATHTTHQALVATKFKPDSNYLHRYKCAMHAGVAEYA